MSRTGKRILVLSAAAIIILIWLNTCVPRTYQATVSGHNAPVTVSVTMVGRRIRNVEVINDNETTGVGKKP